MLPTLRFLAPGFLSLALVACGADDDDDMPVDGPAPSTASPAGGAAPAASADHEDAVDNVAACERLADELDCGGVDLGPTLGCQALADLPCDLGAYFDCVADQFSCDSGVPDVSGVRACVELLACD